METVNYDGVVERWKVDLIAARARRMGFRADEIPDVQQQIILDVIAFRFDADKSNGARESTALQALIDNHLKNICRASARYQAHLEQLGGERPLESDFESEELAADIRAMMTTLTEREQDVCLALARGESKHEIAERLGCGWHTVDRLVQRIREHFADCARMATCLVEGGYPWNQRTIRHC
jgi:RNA polymerase sigma factor (sigma-70 family)